LKGVSAHAVGRELSDAERTNGYEWRGAAFLSATSMRERDKQARVWLPWRDVGAGIADRVANAIETAPMERMRGHWFYVLDGSGVRADQLPRTALTCSAIVSGIHSRSEGDPLQDCIDNYSSVAATASFVPLSASEVEAIRRAKLTMGDGLSGHRDVEAGVFGKTWDKRSKNPETLVKGMSFAPVLSNPEIPAGEDGHNYAGFADLPALWAVAKLADGRIGLIDWGEARDPKGRRPVIAQQFAVGGGTPAGSPKIEVFAPGKHISAPEIMRQVQPEYTDKARAKQIEGTVTLSAVIDKDGRAQQIAVVRSLGMGLDEQAIKAVAQWTFIPALKDGRAIPVSVTFEVHFLLW